MSLEAVRSEVRQQLRTGGLRATAPRIAVLVALHEFRAPMTHEQVMEVLPTGLHDRASVWRILSDLSDGGLLRRMDLGDRVWRYELRDRFRPVDDNHAHFLCEACAGVTCLPPLELRAVTGTLPPFLHSAEVRLKVTGRCAGCQV